MTPSEQCKSSGLESLAQLVRLSGVPKRTLLDWHKHNQVKFTLAIDAVLWRIRNGQS